MVRSLESFAVEVLIEVDGAPGGSFMAVSHFEPAISDYPRFVPRKAAMLSVLLTAS